LSPGDAMTSTVVVETGRSDIDIADGLGSPMDGSSPSASEVHPPETSNHASEDREYSDSDGSSAGNASEDADFDMQASVASQHDADGEPDRDSSPASSRPSKRKPAIVEEDYMRENPELYGLRRSVRFPKHNEMRH
jgi:chromodomain-helicase-DNA-binding protein 1